MMSSLGDVGAILMTSDPVSIELHRLENQLRDKERELVISYSEIKALRATEVLKDKGILELNKELKKLDEKLRTVGNHLECKNVEVKKLLDEKKEALAAQFAAEATLRRVHANQKDEELESVDSIIAPLESNIKMYKFEIAALQEDKKALERLTKCKEVALIESENLLHTALQRALIVDTLQNQNLELKRQIEICKEENKLLEKVNRGKVTEIEKLTQTVCELEESVLASGKVANVARDYQRQLSELNEEKRILERELARVKISANRIANVAANEWKDDSDKVIPIKQWLEEKRLLQGEIQRLRDKILVSERTAKAEAQLKDKLKLRLKTLEDGLKHASILPLKHDEDIQVSGFSAHNREPRVRSSSQPRASIASNKLSLLHQPKSSPCDLAYNKNTKSTYSLKTKFINGENLVKKNLWAPRSKFVDDNGKENAEIKVSSNGQKDVINSKAKFPEGITANEFHDVESENKGNTDGCEDMVSGLLYDRLQKEVISLRKIHEEKDGILNAKEEEIKSLLKKVDTLAKAMEVESRKMRREAAAREKETLVMSEDNKERELVISYSEIKALRATEVLKDKGILELNEELKKLDEKLRTVGNHLECKNVEVKKLLDEKKEALAAQFAAEATLRRVHANQKDEELESVDSIIAPLESNIKMYKFEIAALQEDKKALERLTKCKEVALIESENLLHTALQRALIVDTLQNQNLELKRQIEICKEENKLLEKVNRGKVTEIEKLTQTVCELEESVLASGKVANVARDYQRQLSELNEEKRILERELARVKISANRIANVAANEWKDDSNKVIPIKQWLEEKRLLQGEIQRLRDKILVSERTAKAEAQLKDKLKLRLKTLEDGLKHASILPLKHDEDIQVSGFFAHNREPKVRSSSQPRASIASNKLSLLHQPKSSPCDLLYNKNTKSTYSLKTKFINGENLVKKNLWAPRSKFVDDNGKENAEIKVSSNGQKDVINSKAKLPEGITANEFHDVESENKGNTDGCEDMVSGLLYDRLQKEVISLRKIHEEKDGILNAKEEEIKSLLKKVDTLAKAMEVESRKMRREAAAREKETLIMSEDSKLNNKTIYMHKRATKNHEASMNPRA